jgi:single-strand DNA-binding protein
MPDLNQVYLIGNLTRDPELRRTPSGDAVTEMRMASNRRYKTRDGQDKEETCFVGVVAWGRQAETCAQYLRKGSLILVEGRLQYDQWEKDGQKQSRLRVLANRVQFMGSPRGDAQARPAASAGPDSAGAPPVAAEPEGGSGPPPDGGGDDDNLPF